MVENSEIVDNKVKFIEYTGKYPNLCSGILTLEIEGKIYKFGNSYLSEDEELLPKFWRSGGGVGFTFNDSYISKGAWIISATDLPKELQKYTYDIDRAFNDNVPHGCCGGCL